MDSVFKVIQLTTEYVNSIPAHSWYVLGALIGAGIATFIGVNVVKNRHLKKKAEALSKKFIQLNLAFWAMITSTAAFLVTNGTDINALAAFAPFLKEYVAPVMVISTYIYTFGGNGVYKWATAKLQEWINKGQPKGQTITPVGAGIEEPVAGADFLS